MHGTKFVAFLKTNSCTSGKLLIEVLVDRMQPLNVAKVGIERRRKSMPILFLAEAQYVETTTNESAKAKSKRNLCLCEAWENGLLEKWGSKNRSNSKI